MGVDPSSLLLIIILILLNGFLAKNLMAIMTVNKGRYSFLAEQGNIKAKKLEKILEEPSKFISAIELCITFIRILCGVCIALSLVPYISHFLYSAHIPYDIQISSFILSFVLSFIIILLGELVPKRLALKNYETIALRYASILILIYRIFLPSILLLNALTKFILFLFRVDLNKLEEKVSKEEILSLIEVGEEHGVINKIERDMLDGILDFDDKMAKEVMTPRTEVFLLDIETPIDIVKMQLIEEQYSRIPVYEDDVDNIIGILYLKDFYTKIIIDSTDCINIRELLRPCYFVPETKNIDDLFKELQNTKNHFAILIDEYGAFSGIVTIEDLIEEVMGNIFDEYDEHEQQIKKITTDTYIIDGLLSLDEINDFLGLELDSEDNDTLSGFIVDILGYIPKVSEVINYENLVFTIDSVSERRIETIKLFINRSTAENEQV